MEIEDKYWGGDRERGTESKLKYCWQAKKIRISIFSHYNVKYKKEKHECSLSIHYQWLTSNNKPRQTKYTLYELPPWIREIRCCKVDFTHRSRSFLFTCIMVIISCICLCPSDECCLQKWGEKLQRLYSTLKRNSYC